jgi:hypothetical protein
MGWIKEPIPDFDELSGLTTAVRGDEPLDGAIIGSLHLRREDTARQFAMPPVILDALAAYTLAAARLIGASTVHLVFLHVTFSHAAS